MELVTEARNAALNHGDPLYHRLADEIERLRSALLGIKRAAEVRRRDKDGERHQYYFHTAAAALSETKPSD